MLIWRRVKLPKSFLAVNLSESHTFHKKPDQDEEPQEVPVETDGKEAESEQTNGGSDRSVPLDTVT